MKHHDGDLVTADIFNDIDDRLFDARERLTALEAAARTSSTVSMVGLAATAALASGSRRRLARRSVLGLGWLSRRAD